MLLIDSLLDLKGYLELYIHVYGGRVLAVHPELRSPGRYEGFKRIMSQLLAYDKVPPGADKPLLWLEANSLKELVDRHGRVILLWEHGKPATPDTVVADALEPPGSQWTSACPPRRLQENHAEKDRTSLQPRPPGR